MAAVPAHVLNATAPRFASTGRSRSAILILAAVVAAGAGLAVATLAPARVADPDLVVLMRAMAAIKAALVVVALGVVAWRFRMPTTPRIALAYGASVAAMSFATALIWMSAFIGLAALTFHAALFAALYSAWRDERVSPRRLAG